MSKDVHNHTNIIHYSVLGLGVGLLAIAIVCLTITLVNVHNFQRSLAHILLAGSLALLLFAPFLIVWSYTILWFSPTSEAASRSDITAPGQEVQPVTEDVQGAQPEKEDVAVAPGQAELVQRLSQQLELLQKLQTEQEKQLLEARVALTNREAMLTDWQDRAMEMFRLMERILAGGERLNEGYRRAVQDLLKWFIRFMEPFGISAIITEPGELFD